MLSQKSGLDDADDMTDTPSAGIDFISESDHNRSSVEKYNFSTSDHVEAAKATEGAGSRSCSDGFLSSIDEVCISLFFRFRVRPNAHQPILGLQIDGHSFWNVVGTKRW